MPAAEAEGDIMFDWLLPADHAITILRNDHDAVKALFEEFRKADDATTKKKIMDDALAELKIHAVLEEKIFYPTVRGHVGDQIMNEADEEHHVARVLIAELDAGTDTGDHRDAKFRVLAEIVCHHIKEEETEMLPRARELDIDFVALGTQMRQLRQELLRKGIPPDAEHAMVTRGRPKADSGARAAHRRPTAPRKKLTTHKATTLRTAKTRHNSR